MAKKQKKVESKPKLRPVFVDVLRVMIRGDDDLMDTLMHANRGEELYFSRDGFEMTIQDTNKQLYSDAHEAARLELLDQLTKKGK